MRDLDARVRAHYDHTRALRSTLQALDVTPEHQDLEPATTLTPVIAASPFAAWRPRVKSLLRRTVKPPLQPVRGFFSALVLEALSSTDARIGSLHRELVQQSAELTRFRSEVAEALKSAKTSQSHLSAFTTESYWRALDFLYEPGLGSRTIVCPICEHTSTRGEYDIHVAECQFGGGRLERYGCPRCGFVFGPLKILDVSESMLAADYHLLYQSYREANNTANETRAFRSTAPEKGGLFINWGSGAWSETIDKLRSEGWDVWGYEPAVPPASPFIVGSPYEVTASFDGLFSNNVIEHFRDPVAEFREMASHVRPGGLMTHATSCYELAIADTRFHTSFYVGRSVEVLADRVGLDIVGSERDGDYMSMTFRVR